MVDALLIFFAGLYVFIEYRRGFFCSFVDFCAMVVGLRLFWLSWKPLSLWYHQQGFSPATAYVFGSLTSFLPLTILIIAGGWFVHRMTLINLGDPFETLLAFVFAISGFCVLGRFVLLVLGGLGHEGLLAAIKDSMIGHELYTLQEVREILKKLEPLTNPGEIYL